MQSIHGDCTVSPAESANMGVTNALKREKWTGKEKRNQLSPNFSAIAGTASTYDQNESLTESEL